MLLVYISINSYEHFQVNESPINTYVINLDISKDRLELITKQCKREGIHCHRFPAINGKTLDLKSY